MPRSNRLAEVHPRSQNSRSSFQICTFVLSVHQSTFSDFLVATLAQALTYAPSSLSGIVLLTFSQFNVKKNILCDHCRGSGAASDGDIHTCPACGGAGVRVVKQQVFFMARNIVFVCLSDLFRSSRACLLKVKLGAMTVAAEEP